MNVLPGPAATNVTHAMAVAKLLTRAIGAVMVVLAVSKPSLATTQARALYQQTCVVCHGQGMHGAPIPGVASDWEHRLSYGIDEIYLNVIEGLGNTMPARGACDDCTDQQLEAIVDFMLKDRQ